MERRDPTRKEIKYREIWESDVASGIRPSTQEKLDKKNAR